MSFANSSLVEQEKLPQKFERKMSFGVFFLVYDCRRKGLLVRLPLKDLLFNRTSGYETVHEACLLVQILIKPQSSTYILSSGHHATRVPGLVGLQPDSNLTMH